MRFPSKNSNMAYEVDIVTHHIARHYELLPELAEYQGPDEKSNL